MKKAKKTLAVAVAAVFTVGMLAGCDLVTTDTLKDYAQVIATVDVSSADEFLAGGEYAEYSDVLQPAEILKRDMIAAYVGWGYSYQNSYGASYAATFDYIAKVLAQREINIQYTMAYLFKHGDVKGNVYKVSDYRMIPEGDELARLEFFLTDEEIELAKYSTRVLFNSTIDSQEEDIINGEDAETGTTDRTLPTGVNTENEEYYDSAYRIYTGVNSVSYCGSYKAVDHSTPSTRKAAYKKFLANLNKNELLLSGEDTSDVESLGYYQLELKSAYESAILTKLTNCFEAIAAASLDEAEMIKTYNDIYNTQKRTFADDKSTFESALDSVSDSNFLLTAPEEYYGYVINILLPFSTAQSEAVGALDKDYNDSKGNAYQQRASYLKLIQATDQRASWFTGEEDYSYVATNGYPAESDVRNRLFFNDCLNIETAEGQVSEYEALSNYYGKYTYNGNVYYNETTEKYVLTPNKINIDQFIAEMEGYLGFAGFTTETIDEYDNRGEDYYKQTDYYNEEDGSVDYSKFMYYAGRVTQFKTAFEANNLFVAGSDENTAFSVINELSFAYNTDTAGLNTYLGYSVVVGKTSYVGEFEYAAQYACRQGPGTYVVVPSDYGWHIIYCTFSFVENGDGEIKPFTYNHNDALNVEGSFSNLFYESVKATTVSEYSSAQQQEIVNAFSKCATIYEARYANLWKSLDS